jgi:hypothetical protein
MHQARSCSSCSINWPSHPNFVRCPKCNGETTVMARPFSQIMPLVEANRVLTYALFEEYLEKETFEDRKIREKKVNDTMEQHERESQEIKLRFEEAISRGGFTEDDSVRYAKLEQKLPLAHIHQYVDTEE